MTFFDRKVDLAQFPSDHPLYVMCRAWMRNDPSGSSEEPVQPVLPQVCSYSVYTVYLDIMCTNMLAYKWFIVFYCLFMPMCAYVYIYVYIYIYIYIYICTYVHTYAHITNYHKVWLLSTHGY